MIKRLEINFVHMPSDENIRKYVVRKIGKLDHYMHRTSRESAHAEVMLKEKKSGDGRDHCCEVTLHLPHETINIGETSLNMYTAIDIVELKLRHRIQKYKELHSGSWRRRLANRWSRRAEAQI